MIDVTNKNRVALYCRVSSLEQVEHGVSLDDQRERLEAWVKGRGYQIAHVYVEEGEFGWNDERPQLQNLLLDTW